MAVLIIITRILDKRHTAMTRNTALVTRVIKSGNIRPHSTQFRSDVATTQTV